jgi:P-type Ca2+ transporter type 2B
MMKHIIGQAVFQLVVMVVLVFAGEKFIPEFRDSYDDTIFSSNASWKW